MNTADDLKLGNNSLLFRQYINDAELLASFNDIEFCINHPWQYIPSITHRTLGTNIPLKSKYNKWFDKDVVNKRQVLDFVNLGHTLTLKNYSVHSTATQEVCKRIEDTLDVTCDMHLDCSLGAVSQYSNKTAHAMFIIQIQGETSWKVFDKHSSSVYNNKTSEDSNATIDTVLRSGDMLYIPEDVVYNVLPFEKRISISIPCDINSTPIDRRNLKLNEK